MKAPDREITRLRRELAAAITTAVGGSRGQFFVAPGYGIPQNRMSELARGRVHRHTMEWMIRRIHLMGGTVQLTINLGDVAAEWRRSHLARYKGKRKPIVPLAPYSLYGRGLDP